MGRKRIPTSAVLKPEEKTAVITITRRSGDKYETLIDIGLWPALEGLPMCVVPMRSGREEMYVRVRLDGKEYYLHRLILEGFLNENVPEVDHKSRNSLDNRLHNLRAVDRSTNLKNRKPYTHRSKNSDLCRNSKAA